MTEAELDQIRERVILYLHYHDPAALRPDDIAALLAEVQQARADRRHLGALWRRSVDKRAEAEEKEWTARMENIYRGQT